MKKTIKLLTVIMLILRMLVLTACTEFTEGEKRASTLIKYRDRLRYALEIYTGTCITYEELAQLVYSYEKVQEKWSGEEIVDGVFVPELQLVPPGKYESTEDTRYKITMLDKDENGFIKGLQVSVMDDTSACKVPDNSEQTPVEDNTGSSTEQTTPVETDNTQNVEQKAGVWKLNKEKTYIKEGDTTSYIVGIYLYCRRALAYV